LDKIWKRLRSAWPGSSSARQEKAATPPTGDDHLALARESLNDLLGDERVPADIRAALADDYAEVQILLDKLEHEQVHIAVFGRVSVGKSALINALLGEQRFSTSPLHGETRTVQRGEWTAYGDGNVVLVDTPGINEVDGEQRERLARDVAGRADLLLFVADGDLTHVETEALRELAAERRPLLLILNKADRYSEKQRRDLIDALVSHADGLVSAQDVVLTSAQPAHQLIIRERADGTEEHIERQPEPDVEALRTRLWAILEKEGKTLSALNASLFAGQLSDEVGARILSARRALGDRVIRTWCIGKGVAVALNPIPVVDLVAAAAVDASMIVHLSHTYGLPLNRREAGSLVRTVVAQMALLMGTVWAVHVASSALKLGTGGLSPIATGLAQGAVAYYSTYVVGRAAEHYLANGRSWGDAGPKLAVREILASLDRESILEQAKADLQARLKRA
jgi:small GTP-binding protein